MKFLHNEGFFGEEMNWHNVNAFFAFALHIFWCQNDFFSLGIKNKFVIAYSFSCIFTSDRGIIFDLRRYFFVCVLSWSGSMSHSWLVTTTGLWYVTWMWKKIHVNNRWVVFGIFWHLSHRHVVNMSTTFPTKLSSLLELDILLQLLWHIQ